MSASKDIRGTLHSAYSFIRSIEMNKAVTTVTLDNLLQEHLDNLKGKARAVVDQTGKNTYAERSSRYDQITAIQTRMEAAVEAIKAAKDSPEELQALGIYPESKGVTPEEPAKDLQEKYNIQFDTESEE